MINEGLCWFGNFFWTKIKWTFYNIFHVIWGHVHLIACSPPWNSGTSCKRSAKTWKMPNPQQKRVLPCSRREYNNWRKRHSQAISCYRKLKIRYCSSLKTNLFNNDLLTSVWKPTPPPNIFVIIIIIFGTGYFKTCFCALYVSSLFLHCHVFSYFLSPLTLMKFQMQESVSVQ